jgi:ubiquitin-like-conjugating enzyme ATG10
VNETSVALTNDASPFPLLSQGEHPTTGTPYWYFHPCETSKAVGEIMEEAKLKDWSREERLLKWMNTWFMVLGSAVDLHIGL